MLRKRKPDFFCYECRAGITEKDIESGQAVRRYDRVYCLEHFNELFPDECPGHPGTEATEKCSLCGRLVCENCIIELADKKFCAACKPAVIGEFITGQPATPPRIKRFFKPFIIRANTWVRVTFTFTWPVNPETGLKELRFKGWMSDETTPPTEVWGSVQEPGKGFLLSSDATVKSLQFQNWWLEMNSSQRGDLPKPGKIWVKNFIVYKNANIPLE